MIVIVDYDMGNLASIKNMFHKIGYADTIISRDYKDIEKADGIILPGVGAFDQGIKNLKRFGLDLAIKNSVINKKKKIIGICLGMQLLGESSEEGRLSGLGLIPFHSVKFNYDSKKFKIPHMGWDEIIIRKDDPIVNNMDKDEQRFYFVHSYHAVCDNESDVLMTCNYGYEFVAAVSKGNVYGFQFHPEKSHKFGIQLFRNYLEIIQE